MLYGWLQTAEAVVLPSSAASILLAASPLQAAKMAALFPGVISILLAALPRLQLTLSGVALYSACLAVLYGGVPGPWDFKPKPPLWLIPVRGWNGTPSYAIALTVTLLLMYALHSRSGLRSDRAFAKRPGSAFLCGLLTFALTAMTVLSAAVLLQWFMDHVWQIREDTFTAPSGACAMWLLGLALGLPRRKQLEQKHRWAACIGCVLAFPAVFGQFFWLQFAWKWTF